MKKNLYGIFDKKNFNNALQDISDIKQLPPALFFLPYLPENDPLVNTCNLDTLWPLNFNYYISAYEINELLQKNASHLLDLFIHQPDYFNQHFVPYLDRIDSKIFLTLIEKWMVSGNKKQSYEYDEYETTNAMERFIKGNPSLISEKHLIYFEQWHARQEFDTTFLHHIITINKIYSPSILTWAQYPYFFSDDSILMDDQCAKSILPFFFKRETLYQIAQNVDEHLAWLEDHKPTLIHLYLQYYVQASLRLYRNKYAIAVSGEINDIPQKYRSSVCDILNRYLIEKGDSYYLELDCVLSLLLDEPNASLLKTHITHFRSHKLTIEYLHNPPYVEQLQKLDEITFAGLISILDVVIIDRYDGWNLVPDHLIELAQQGIISPRDIGSHWKQYVEKNYQYAFEEPELFFGTAPNTQEIPLSL